VNEKNVTRRNYNYFCTYDLNRPLENNVLDACILVRGQVGGGWALEFESFLVPVKRHRADRRVPFGAQKLEILEGEGASDR
jgi:hypothetical protein